MVKERIKKLMHRYPLLYFIVKGVRNRDFINNCLSMDDDPNILRIVPNTNNNMKQPICIVNAGMKSEGFFASFRWALDGIIYCMHCGFIPVIRFNEESPYGDKKRNAYDCYFEQPFPDVQETLGSTAQIAWLPKMRNDAEAINGSISYHVKDEYIDQLSFIIKKYIRFKKEVEIVLDDKARKLGISNRVLGVHMRGGDFRVGYNGHPIHVPVEYYKKIVYEAIGTNKWESVFIATDDAEKLDEFLGLDSDIPIIYDNDVVRTTNEQGVHFSEAEGFKLGLDVICDMYLLSKCGGIITGLSQVGIIARAYKRSRNESYAVDQLLDMGINTNTNYYE